MVEEEDGSCSRCGCVSALHREDEVVRSCQLARLRTQVLILTGQLLDARSVLDDFVSHGAPRQHMPAVVWIADKSRDLSDRIGMILGESESLRSTR